MSTSHLLAVVSLLAIAKPVAAGESKPRVIVLGLVAERGLDDGLARLLDEFLLTEITDSGRFEVFGGSDIQAMLSHEQRKQMVGCDDSACLAEVGGALGGKYLIFSNVGRVSDSYLLNVKLIDVDSAVVKVRFSKQVSGTESALIEAIRRAVAKITRIDATAGTSSTVASSSGPIVTADAGPADSGPGLLPYVLLGGAVVLGGTGGALLALKRGKDDITGNEYGTYLSASNAERDVAYGDVEAAVSRHNTMVYVGWALVGAGVAGAAAGIYSMMSGGQEKATVSAVPSDGGAVLVLTGEF